FVWNFTDQSATAKGRTDEGALCDLQRQSEENEGSDIILALLLQQGKELWSTARGEQLDTRSAKVTLSADSGVDNPQRGIKNSKFVAHLQKRG
ncbi:hypothetical protein BaRGS_00000268, partial [Batillaria attramentaria]